MNNTKWLRRALLGGAALSVMATGAQADELAALKAQLEALQSRVSQLESQPAPELPPGTKLLTVRRGQGTYGMVAPLPATDRLQDHQGYTIAVTPTADMPAPVSEVTVSGEIRARALYQDYEVESTVDLNANTTTDVGEDDFDFEDFDITTRGRLRIDGRTETAIGEVGGTLRIQATRNGGGDQPYYIDHGDEDSNIEMNIIWGYWQMTPNWQFGGGYWDSAAAIQAGWDWNGEPSLVGLDAGPTNKSVSQFRFTYSNGGLTAAIALEDNNNRAADCPSWEDCTDTDTDNAILGDAVFPAIAGFITFDSGSFLVTAAGVWEPDDSDFSPGQTTFTDTEDNWMVGIGAILRVSDMFRLEGAANIGEGYTGGTYGLQACSSNSDDCENDFEYWNASIMAVVSFHEAMRLELGAAYTDLDHEDDEFPDADYHDLVEEQWTVAASLFWDPVDQLTLGIGVGFTHKEATGDTDDDDDVGEYDSVNAGFGAWFRF